MNNAEMKKICFDERDVIATSGLTMTLSGFGDGNTSNNIITLGNDTTNIYSSTNKNAVYTALNTYFGVESITGDTYVIKPDSETAHWKLSKFLSSKDAETQNYNNTYTYVNNEFKVQ